MAAALPCGGSLSPVVEISPFGRREPHRLPIRVYYEDTDAAGIVYYANYLRFAERARTEFLRTLGFDHAQLKRRHGVGFAVRRCVIEYRQPARLDDRLEVLTRVAHVRGASIDLAQEVTRADGLLAMLEVRLVVLDQALRCVRLPVALAAAFRHMVEDGFDGETGGRNA